MPAGTALPDIPTARTPWPIEAATIRRPRPPAFSRRPTVAPRRTSTVQLRTLGGFGVLRDGQPVEPREWPSRKAADLLKILVTRRGQPTPREMLGELLWPGIARNRSANRLSVALSTIRAVLDPDRRNPSDQFLGTGQLIVTMKNVTVDVETFLVESDLALSGYERGTPFALGSIEAAVDSYHGDFLAGDARLEWAVPLREEAKLSYLRLVRTLAVAAGRAGQHDRAIYFWAVSLDHDAYDEQAHLGLVTALRAAGRPGEAIRRYGVYARRMNEIGITPTPPKESDRGIPGVEVP